MHPESTRESTGPRDGRPLDALAPGASVAGYRIEERIGAGGMGVVFRAFDPGLARSVALKLVAPGRARDPRFRELFIRESLAAASLEHPNVVPVYRAGEDDGHLYLAMRFVEGASLDVVLAERGRLAPGHAARIVADAASALDAAHAAGLVHGDVKPANLLITRAEEGGRALLTDFGLSRRVGGGTDGGPGGRGWVGTLSYLAPEQIRREAVGPAADVYSLGCLLFHALTGRVPYAGGEAEVIEAHLTAAPPRPSAVAPGLPLGLDDVVARAMAKRPEDRFASAGELAAAALALRPDVFLLHRPEDAAEAARLARALRDEGLDPWTPPADAGDAAHRREERLEGLRSSAGCVVVVGASGLGGWAREELAVAQELAVRDRGFRLVMVLLPGAPEPFDPRLAFLAARPWVDLRADETDPDGLRALARAVGGDAGALRPAVRRDGDVCPYRGLEAFDEDHAEFFVGREDEVARALEHLRSARLLAVVGPSGSGKSSLVRAGLVPAVRAGALPGSEGWSVCLLTPGDRPLAALAAALGTAVPGASVDPEALRADPRALDRAAHDGLAGRPPEDRLLLVVDQFEELFALTRDEADRTAFIDGLTYAASIPGGRVAVVLAMRADFYPRCAAFPELAALVAARQLLVGPLGPRGLRRAIEEPARVAGLELEEGLARRIRDDVGRRAGALPLMEHVLVEVWRRRRGRLLTAEAYAASGSLEGALAKRANDVFAALPEPERRTARRVLLRLTQPGEGAEDTRRRALMSELAGTGDEAGNVERVVGALADARLLTVGRDPVGGGTTVEVAHEALIRGWPRLRRWIDDDRDALRLHRRLTEAASEWEAAGRDDDLLYAGARLAPWQEGEPGDLNPLEREFLTAAVGRETRLRRVRRRRVRATIGGLVAGVVAIAGVAAFALVQRDRAADERDVAVSRQLSVSAADQLDGDPQLGLLLALDAWDASPTDAAEEQLRQATFASRAAAVLGGHRAAVKDAAFSPDGRTAWSAGEDGTVRSFDVASRTAGTVLDANGDLLQAVAVSPDGGRVAAAGNAGVLWIWDLGTGARRGLRGHEGAIYTVAFSPDGRRLATSGEDATVRMWPADGDGEPRVLRGHTDVTRGALFALDGRSLVSISSDRTVRLWDVATGRGTRVLQAGRSLRSLGVGPGGAIIAGTDGEDWLALHWATPRGAPRIAGRHANEVYGVAIAPDGRTLASTGADGTVRVWDVRGGPALAVLRGHVGFATNVVFDPSGTRMLTSSLDNTVRIWEVAPERLPTVHWGGDTGTLDQALSPDGRLLMVGEVGGGVNVHERAGGRAIRTLDGPTSEVWGVDVAPDGAAVAAGSAFEAVWVWDPRTGRRLARLTDGGGSVDVDFSPDGRHLAGAGQDGTLRVWAWPTGRLERELGGHDAILWSTAFSPDGRLLASASGDGTARVRTWPGGDEVSVLRGHEGTVWQVDLSGDGARAVTAGDDRTVRVWDVPSGRQLALLRGHTDSANSAVFSPDGTRVLSASDDDTVRVWDWRRGVQVQVFRGFRDATSARFTPDGAGIVAGDGAGAVRELPCETCGPIDDVVALARTRAVRSLTEEEREVFLPR